MCKWNVSSERFDACDGISRCYCVNSDNEDYYAKLDYYEQLEEEMYKPVDRYCAPPTVYGNENWEPMVCDKCSVSDEMCECPRCIHCGGAEDISIIKIKCPVSKCVDLDDKVCINCKNVHDREHGL